MIRHTLKLGWWLIILTLILAVFLTAFRFAFPLLGEYRQSLEVQLSKQLGLPVQIGELETSWRGPFPQVAIRNLSAELNSANGPSLAAELEQISFEINLWQSLLDFAPIFQRVDASGLRVDLAQAYGEWLPDLGRNTEINTETLALVAKLLLVQPSLLINNSKLNLQIENGPLRSLNLDSLLLENAQDDHQLSGDFWIPALGRESRIGFVAQSNGEPHDLQNEEIPFYLKLDRLGTQLFDLFEPPVDIPDLDTSLELWGELQGTQLRNLSGKLDIKRALVSLPDADFQLIDTQTYFQLIPLLNGYQLQLHETRVGDALGGLFLPRLAIDLHSQSQQFRPSRVMMEGVDLEQLSAWLVRQPVPEELKSILVELKPGGLIERAVVDLNDQKLGPRLLADIYEGRVDASHGVPEMRGITGLIEVDKQAGALHLNSQTFSLRPEGLYDQALEFDRAEGRVDWALDTDGVWLSSSELSVSYQGAEASGQFSVDLSYDPEQQAMLNLQMGLRNADAPLVIELTPRAIVGDPLYSWIRDAIRSGEVTEAGLVIYTPIRKLEDSPQPSVELYLDVKNMGLDYKPTWPELEQVDGFVHLRGGGVAVQVSKAQVLDQNIDSALVWHAKDQPLLNIDIDLTGDLDDVDRLFREPPLDQSVGRALDDWHFVGPHTSHLGLRLSLDGASPPKVLVGSQVTGGVFKSDKQRITLSEIDGLISFDSQTGIFFDEVRTSFLGTSLQVSASSDKTETQIGFKGEFDSKTALEWAKLPLVKLIKGPVSLDGKLRLCRSADCSSQLQLESTLDKASVLAPDYLAKAANTSRRLSLIVGLAKPVQVQLNYADRLKGRFEIGTKLRGTLTLGGDAAKLSDQSGLLVNGKLPELDVAQLLPLVSALDMGKKSGGEPMKFATQIYVDKVGLGSVYAEGVNIDLRQANNEWHLTLDGGVQGLVAWGQTEQYRVALDKVSLESSATTQEREPKSLELTDIEILKKIPEIDMEVASLNWRGVNYGRWQGLVRTRAEGVGLNQLVGILPGLSFTGSADWNLGPYEASKIVLNYQGQDLGDTLSSLGQARTVETESLEGTLGLVWAGAPWHYATERLDGYLSFTTGKGRLIESGSGSGLLRLFGILNFNTLARRLTLDFSDLFQKGIVFDRLNGQYGIKQGIVTSAQPLTMEGPSANMSATGQVNLIERTFDQQVLLTLPLVSNTPLAAILLGAPQIAGALFIIDKLMGDQLAKATAISYHLKGPWSEPEVEVDSAKK